MTATTTGNGLARADWDNMMPAASDDRLLLLEQAHRVANEVAAALAALHLVRNASGSRPRWKLLNSAIDRLEGFAAVNRAIAVGGAGVDLGVELERLCVGLGAARREARGSRVTLDVASVEVDGGTARRVLMVAAELVSNAVRHSLEGRDGRLVVVLRRDGDDVAMSVIDDGPGIGCSPAPGGSGMGGPIVRELVRRAGGLMECDTGPDGTSFHVLVPIGGGRADG